MRNTARATVGAAFLAVTTGCSSGAMPATSEGSAATAPTPSPAVKGMGRGPDGTGLQRFYGQRATWQACASGKGFQCTDIWVPLDYRDPDGPAIKVTAAMLTAQGRRSGTLFINPGGPGVSGRQMLAEAKFSPALRTTYDIVGFDPRGVGGSTPVDCLDDAELDAFLGVDNSPETPEEVSAYQQAHQSFVDGCRARSGRLMEHMSTVETARDLDVLRSAVGEEKLDYLGISYGTYLGATYAALFPTRVDRMVLDAAVDPTASSAEFADKQTEGFELALTSYLTACVASRKCPFGSSVNQARAKVAAMFAQIDAKPQAGSSGRKVTDGVAHMAVIAPLYAKATWPLETQVLAAGMAGKGDALLAAMDLMNKRGPKGYLTNQVEANQVINCLDHPDAASVEDLTTKRANAATQAPVFGPVTAWARYPCSNWPVKAVEGHPDWKAEGAAPILVIGTTGDPATPYQQSVRLAQTLSSGVLVTRKGDGHSAFTSGDACSLGLIDKYLTTGAVPGNGTVCG